MRKQLIWRKSECVLKTSDFKRIEEGNGVVFPSDFKEIIGPINGSRLKDGYINHPQLGEIAYSGNISISNKSKYNVWETKNDIFPDEKNIPFGDVGNGDYIFLNLNDGYIYLWEHETGKVYFLYNTTNELFENIVSE